MSSAVVDIYCLNADACEARLFEPVLSAQEHERAARFRFERDRHRYVVRRGRLRQLLGGYLDCKPEEVSFAINPFGKLSLPMGEFRFNLSHSNGMTLYAIAAGIEVGCDIERCDPKFCDEQIPERFFSATEIRALRALHPARQTEAFFNCWTRKEAFIKARGMGLSLPLDSFDVSLVPGERAALKRGCEGWSVHAFEPVPGYRAAVVGEGSDWRVSFPDAPASRGAMRHELRYEGAASAQL